MIFAVDFDGTISKEDNYPGTGDLIPFSKETINKLYDKGHEIIIWTSRDNDTIENVVNFLQEHGIKYHGINESSKTLLDKYGNNPRKIGADCYIDDKTIGMRKKCGNFNWEKFNKNLDDYISNYLNEKR